MTLVNDNSESTRSRAVLAFCLTDRLQCKRSGANETPFPRSSGSHPRSRQEFYIKFKGPTES